MKDTTSYYFKSYEEWKEGITVQCKIELTPEYTQKRIAALSNPDDKTTQEFTAKYGNDYLQQVIEWFSQAQKECVTS